MSDLEEIVVWAPVAARWARWLASQTAQRQARDFGYQLGAFIGVTQDGSGWLYRWSVIAPDALS